MPAQDRVQAHPDSYLAELRADVRAGLTAEPKSLPPKYFYDERGSELFEEITRLPEYYPTRAETAILRARAGELAELSRCESLVELGSGTSAKTGLLLRPAQHAPLDQQSLSARPESLDAALTSLRLSPFPALVVGVEGATEYLLVPRVMDLLGIQWDTNRIRIVDFGGTDKDLALLARYAVEPVLGRDFTSGVALDRPLTRFLVMTDAEHKYATAAGRRKQRKLLLESLTVNVPKDLRSDYYVNTRRGRVVEIVTWGKLPFEFAHFTDQELADGMLSATKVPHPRGRDGLVRILQTMRRGSGPYNVERLFWRGSGLTKPGLAEALWPVLEAKINTAIQRGKPGPPVMRACVRAYEIASASAGLSMMLRRRRWRRR